MFLSGAVVALGLMAQSSAFAQDAAAGERLFNQCRACHQLGETARNGVGPQLNGLFAGRKAGTAAWSEDNFRVYIKDPRGVTPGTKMVYAGMKDDTQITNLIAFLKQWGADGKRTQ
jgi:cytochrome c